jgi:DNA topoisomerase III
VLSIGRVQTPTLALIVRREAEIKAFVPETFWTLDVAFQAQAGRYWGRLWHEGGERHPETIAQAAQAASVAGTEGVITKLEKKRVSEAPPLLFDLTSLQREANNKFGFSAKRTLQAAQRLYEQHAMLTYPRTDSRYISTDVAETVPELLPKLASYAPLADFVGLEPRYDRCVDDKKVSDHHAIIPTGVVTKLDGDDAKLYDLVARRFLATLSPNAEVERTSLTTSVEQWEFRSRGRIILFAGWRALYGEEEAAASDEMPQQALPAVEADERVTSIEQRLDERQTKPPARYSDASLLGAMETAGKTIDDEELKEALKDSGLGTPATRASIIETLINREYVNRQGKQLVPTEKGVRLIELLGEHPLTSAELTGSWEQQLNAIANGAGDVTAFQKAIRAFTEETVKQLSELSVTSVPRAELGPCPGCGKEVRENRKGYSCWSKADPGCGFVIWKGLAGHSITPDEAATLMSERVTEPITFPNGRDSFQSRIALTHEDGVWKTTLPEAPLNAVTTTREAVAPCPGCGRDVWENRKGYSCWTSKDPGCGLVIWKSQAKVTIALEAARTLLTERKVTTDDAHLELVQAPDESGVERWFVVINGERRAAFSAPRGAKQPAAKKKAPAKTADAAGGSSAAKKPATKRSATKKPAAKKARSKPTTAAETPTVIDDLSAYEGYDESESAEAYNDADLGNA